MMKDKIVIQRDIEIQRLKDSQNLSVEEKMYLTELVSDAADGTNGLDEKDKLQNVSETTFKLATLMSRVVDKANSLPKIENSLSEINNKLTVLKTSSIPSNWKDFIKVLTLKPWIWICIGIGTFSPYFIDILKFLVSFYKN